MELEKRGGLHFDAKTMKSVIPFALIHIVPPIVLIWLDGTLFDWLFCVFFYFFRMFFITGGYHRYFAHRTYKTSRVFQFIIAFFAQTSVQKGALWWAAHHRVHHKYSDTPKDPHSMKLYGFLYSHLGWILGPDYKETHFELIKDYSKYKELRWLNKFHLIPPFLVAIGVFFLGDYINPKYFGEATNGWSTLTVGFFVSTAFLYHGTFSINSIMHLFGSQRYRSNDESRNNLFLALITLGEGWHNNHHYYQATVRQGFFWWEIDITYYILKVLSWFGIVWDLAPVPHHIKHSKDKEDAMRLAREAQDSQS